MMFDYQKIIDRKWAPAANNRRGIALILVVTLIVIFFLLATTFVSMSTSFLRTSKRSGTRERLELRNRTEVLENALMMVIRDTVPGPGGKQLTPISTHSLLTDLYGLNPTSTLPAATSPRGFNFGVPVSPVGGLGFFVRRIERLNAANSGHNYAGQVFGVVVSSNDPQPSVIASQWANLTRDQLVGRYLTFVDGPLSSQTVSIVNSQHNGTEIRLWVLVDSDNQPWEIAAANPASMPARSRMVINGRPYAGGSVNSNIISDLFSSYVVDPPRNTNQPFDAGADIPDVTYDGVGTVSSASEDLFMATNLPGGVTDPMDSGSAFSTRGIIVPSFHRFSEIAKRVIDPSQGVSGADVARMKRVSPLFHPYFTGSNPAATFLDRYDGNSNTSEVRFNLSNQLHRAHLARMLSNQKDPNANYGLDVVPDYALLDVDSDGDGVNDSFWMDIGLAPIITGSGKKLKPLVAFMIEDQGGKINLNTAGSNAHETGSSVAIGSRRIATGQGVGAAEIRVKSLLNRPGQIGAASIVPSGFNVMTIRYGQDSAPGIRGSNPQLWVRKNGEEYEPIGTNDQTDGLYETLVANPYGSIVDDVGQFVFSPTGQSPRKRNGSFQLGNVNYSGGTEVSPSLPFAVSGSNNIHQMFTDSPYSFDVFGNSSDSFSVEYFNRAGRDGRVVAYANNAIDPNRDRKYDVEFLELMNRVYDRDFSARSIAYVNQVQGFYPNRANYYRNILQNLARNTGKYPQSVVTGTGTETAAVGAMDRFRRQLTTESYSIPTIPFNIAAFMRRLLVEQNATRAAANKIPFTDNGAIGAGTIERELIRSLGPDIIAGLPFNLKPVFGNGDDENSNDVVDEAAELTSNQIARGTGDPSPSGDVLGTNGFVMDLDNDGVIPGGGDTDEYQVRYMYARQLYTLTLLLTTKNHSLNVTQIKANANELRLRIALAQWAINAVDFQDADSTISVFEFDINPFDGWDVNGDATDTDPLTDGSVNQERFIVYGVEQPELLITEATAFHDKGMQDFEDPASTADPKRRELMQSHVPYGPAFFELYNPNIQPRSNVNTTAELRSPSFKKSDGDTFGLISGVHINKVNGNNEPVFRVVVVRESNSSSNSSRGANTDRTISAFDQFLGQDPQEQPASGGPGGPGGGSGGPIDYSFNVADVHSIVYFADPRDLNNRQNGATFGALATNPAYALQFVKPPQQFYFKATGTEDYQRNLVVLPGHHAVVGTAGPHADSNGRTIFGRSPMDPEVDTVNPGAPVSDRIPYHLARSEMGSAGRHVNPFVFHGRPTIQLQAGELVRIGRISIVGDDLELDRDEDFQMDEIPFSIGIPLNRQIVNGSDSSQDVYSVFSLTMPVPTDLASVGGGSAPDGYTGRVRIQEKDGFRYDTPFSSTTQHNDEIDHYGSLEDIDEIQKHLVLQRLANPNQPFHPVANPYITLDHSGVNLNAYNGKQTEKVHLANNRLGGGSLSSSLQRGELGSVHADNGYATQKGGQQNDKNIWRRALLGRWASNEASGTQWFRRPIMEAANPGQPPSILRDRTIVGAFPSQFFYTQKEITDGFQPNSGEGNSLPALALNTLRRDNSYFTLAGMYQSVNATTGLGTGAAMAARGMRSGGELFANQTNYNTDYRTGCSLGELNESYANERFAPWFRIPNRPLVSAMELMEVPCQSNALLLEHISFPEQNNENAYDVYGSDLFGVKVTGGDNQFKLNDGVGGPVGGPIGSSGSISFPTAGQDKRIAPYLLNFFTDTDASSNNHSIARVLEFVSTPDRYIGSYRYLDPNVFSGDSNGLFNHPYNWFNNRRIPGRLNVNRVFQKETYEEMMGGPGTAYVQQLPFDNRNQFDRSGPAVGFENDTKDCFAGSFIRNISYDSSRNGDLTATNRWVHNTKDSASPKLLLTSPAVENGGSDPYDIEQLSNYKLDFTWFRKKARSSDDHEPLFDFENGSFAYNTRYNPYFKNLMRQRLANMTTNRSSVFNIWITVGYFEIVEAEVPNFTNPAQLTSVANFVTTPPAAAGTVIRETIGKEYGIDDGQVRRDRMFVIYDRSIPVGFTPGYDLNTRKGILLKRIIERN